MCFVFWRRGRWIGYVVKLNYEYNYCDIFLKGKIDYFKVKEGLGEGDIREEKRVDEV